MGNVNLEEIIITPLLKIEVVGGDVLHILKHSDSVFSGFGEAYFSIIESGSIKAWKRHTEMTMNIVVPFGKVRFVFYIEGRDEFRIEELGIKCYSRITVPPGVWFGFQGISEEQSLVLNIANIQHDPNEVERRNLEDINFNWQKL
jgi:dTDP-4-dehydrorhamnose 3,5-epimerase